MKGKRANATATMGDRGPWRMVAWAVVAPIACAPMVPAIMANVDVATGRPASFTVLAVLLVVCSALALKGSWLLAVRKMRGLAVIAAAVGLFFLLCNVWNAFDLATSHGDHKRDLRADIIANAEKSSSQRSAWSQDRSEVAKVAGVDPPAAYESQIQRTIAADSRRWQLTEECNPLKITIEPSRVFCSAISDLRTKKAAAEKRDELDRKIAALDAHATETPAVSSEDPSADNIAEILGLFGYKLDADQKRIASRAKDWVKPIAMEIMASFMPMLIVAMAHLLIGSAAPARSEEPAKPETRKATPTAEAPPATETKAQADAEASTIDGDDPFHAFVAETLEACPGSIMKASEPWNMWQHWCSRKGIDAGSQRGFGLKLQKVFAHDRNGNRPRYLNCRAKGSAPTLRLAVSNG